MSKHQQRFREVIFLLIFCTFYYSSIAFIYPNSTQLDEGSACRFDNLDGICAKASDCAIDFILLKYTQMCAYTREDALYCCVNPVEVVRKLRPIERICDYYHPRSVLLGQIDFAGGYKALADQHPHMAAIGWTNDNKTVDYRCGGSAVTSNFIITAAHCTSQSGKSPDVVRTGDLNLLVTENYTNPEDFRVTQIYVHPQYKSDEAYHDIALLKITPDFRKKPACLWNKYEIPTEIAIGMGYGTREFSGPQSNELYQGSLNLMSPQQCTQNVPISSYVPKGIIPQQLCAHDPYHEKDTCQGDSGGPLQFKHKVVYSRPPMIVGITSFGQNCAGSTPGVYTRVSEYIDWIENILMSDFHNTTAEIKTS